MTVRRTNGWSLAAFCLLTCWWSTVASAQDGAGHAPVVATGEVGQRQTRAESAPNFEPLGRVQSRVQNRIQSRLRNRVDRFYDPTANAASPFQTASDQARISGRFRAP